MTRIRSIYTVSNVDKNTQTKTREKRYFMFSQNLSFSLVKISHHQTRVKYRITNVRYCGAAGDAQKKHIIILTCKHSMSFVKKLRFSVKGDAKRVIRA